MQDGTTTYGGGRDGEFAAFVQARRAALLRLATLLAAGDGHLAEDLVQTALTRLYVSWWRVDKEHGPEAYCRRILVNTLVDERRRPWRRSETSRAELPDHARLLLAGDPALPTSLPYAPGGPT